MVRLSHLALSLGFFAIMSCGTPAPHSDAMVMEEPIMAEPMVMEDIVPAPPRARRSQTRAGVLTAGDIDDGLNWRAFQRYLKKARSALRLPLADFRHPVVLHFIADGEDAPGARVTLRAPGATTPFWSGYSGVDGRLVVYPRLFDAGRPKAVLVRAFAADGQLLANTKVKTGALARVTLTERTQWSPDFLDLVFVVDATGSMGDEMDWLTRDLLKIVGAAKRRAPGVDIRYGLVLYRDRGDAFVVRNFGFTASGRKMKRWLRAQNAAGGGDYPEAAAEGLRAAADLNWRRGKGERLVFHLADAPPHPKQSRAYLDAAADLARKDVQIFGLGASGVAAESEFLMRQAAAMNNGRYIFLTDDSGVGHGHAEPTITCYRVTRLSRLIRRILASELSGQRLEASENSIIREVGSYQGGKCRN